MRLRRDAARSRSGLNPVGGVAFLLLFPFLLALATNLVEEASAQEGSSSAGQPCRRDRDCLEGTRLRCQQVDSRSSLGGSCLCQDGFTWKESKCRKEESKESEKVRKNRLIGTYINEAELSYDYGYTKLVMSHALLILHCCTFTYTSPSRLP